MKKLTILFLTILLFSCCPEKNNQQNKSSEVVQIDFSRSRPVPEEKKGIISEEDFELIGDYYEEEFGPA